MKLKVFTLRLNPASGIFDESELAEFQSGKDVIEVSEHFLVHEKTPTLLLVVRYRELPDSGRSSPEALRKDWRAELDDTAKRIYDELRLWRGRTAKREGMPPYLILNNRELAERAMKRPANVTQLREIEGIGEAKSKRWGEEILALLTKLAAITTVNESALKNISHTSPDEEKPGGGSIRWRRLSRCHYSFIGRKRFAIFFPVPKNFRSASVSLSHPA